MKGAVLSVLASGAAAQITSMPFPALGLGPHVFQNNAINPTDPEYSTCQQAVGIVQDCVSSVGGLDAAATADPSALVACACCDGRDPWPGLSAKPTHRRILPWPILPTLISDVPSVVVVILLREVIVVE